MDIDRKLANPRWRRGRVRREMTPPHIGGFPVLSVAICESQPIKQESLDPYKKNAYLLPWVSISEMRVSSHFADGISDRGFQVKVVVVQFSLGCRNTNPFCMKSSLLLTLESGTSGKMDARCLSTLTGKKPVVYSSKMHTFMAFSANKQQCAQC